MWLVLTADHEGASVAAACFPGTSSRCLWLLRATHTPCAPDDVEPSHEAVQASLAQAVIARTHLRVAQQRTEFCRDSRQPFRALLGLASTRSAGDRSSLPIPHINGKATHGLKKPPTAVHSSPHLVTLSSHCSILRLLGRKVRLLVPVRLGLYDERARKGSKHKSVPHSNTHTHTHAVGAAALTHERTSWRRCASKGHATACGQHTQVSLSVLPGAVRAAACPCTHLTHTNTHTAFPTQLSPGWQSGLGS